MPIWSDAATLPALVDAVLNQAGKLLPKHFFWYRGVTCASYELLPGLLRGKPRDMKEVFEREMRLLVRFRQRSLPYWDEGYSQNLWEHLFAMQHHGVPTRLLDWTENLFVALHFALLAPNPAPGHADACHPGQPCTPGVWILDPKTWNRRALDHQEGDGDEAPVLTVADPVLEFYGPETADKRMRPRYKQPVAIYGTHNSARIVAQRGTFTIAGNEWKPLDYYADTLPRPDLNGLYAIKIMTPAAEARSQLRALGFTESMIYPDLSGLSRELTELEDWR